MIKFKKIMCLCVCVISFLIVVLRLDFAIHNHCLTFTMKKMGHKTKSNKKEKKNAVYLCLILISNGNPDTHGNFACMILINLILTVND